MNVDLSVIVIGRNEAKTLNTVFGRFKELCACAKWKCRLIYVDSDSSDSSISIAMSFKKQNPECDIRIFGLQGNINASVARNVGIQNMDPHSNYVFFLDADIVFDVAFVDEAIGTLEQNPNIGTVSGTLTDSFDAPGTQAVMRPIAQSMKGRGRLWHGGNFIAKRHVVENVGRFDMSLVRHQDIDYSFRIRNAGYVLWMARMRMGTHYTTAYMSLPRVIHNLRQGHYTYSGLLFRKHLMSRRCIDASRATSGVLFRCFVLCCVGIAFFFRPAGIVALAGFIFILSRKSGARGESLRSRALSFVAGIQFVRGLFKPRGTAAGYRLRAISPSVLPTGHEERENV